MSANTLTSVRACLQHRCTCTSCSYTAKTEFMHKNLSKCVRNVHKLKGNIVLSYFSLEWGCSQGHFSVAFFTAGSPSRPSVTSVKSTRWAKSVTCWDRLGRLGKTWINNFVPLYTPIGGEDLHTILYSLLIMFFSFIVNFFDFIWVERLQRHFHLLHLAV